MKKILMIVLNDFVNDSRIIKEASTLGSNGFEVKILALHNNGLKLIEHHKYFTVERIKLNTREKLSNTNPYLQILKYIEFYKKCISKGLEFQPEIIHCHDLNTLPIGYRIKTLIKNSIMIYDSHELWSDLSSSKSFPKLIMRTQNYIEKTIIKKVHKVITVSDSIADYMQTHYKLKNRPEVIRNIPIRTKIDRKNNIFREEYVIPDKSRIILYQGMVDPKRGIDKVIDSIPYLDNNVVLVILGNGSALNDFKAKVESMGLVNKVFFHEAVDSSILINYTNSADVGISILENDCLSYYYSLPNKLFEYIQGELPVVCSDFPDMAKIINKYEIGKAVNPADAKGIADAVKELLLNQDTYINKCQQAKEVLSWENEERKLLKIYQELI